MSAELAVVTGAFSYTGRHIAALLLDRGSDVRTLTRFPYRSNPFGEDVDVRPYCFDDPDALVASLRGASTLYNTYWVRFARGQTDFDLAVRHSTALFEAAKRAGIERVVHVSITNPYKDPALPYFRGKAVVEGALTRSGLSFGIVRATVMFGGGDVFINNIAWLIRTFPFFPIPGSGRYRLQPIHVDDVADICVRVGGRSEDITVDAAGPEIFAFEDLIQMIRNTLGRTCPLIHVRPRLAYWLARIVGLAARDVVLTMSELDGLMRELIVSDETPTGSVQFSAWLADNAEVLGRRYESELHRNYPSPRSHRRAHARTRVS
jgi:NADH dehydrogenase